jgi:Putative polyhydroxyalkanoic acid system protein (PHA_gran_rgn)
MKIQVEHHLSREVAKQRIEELIEHYRQEYKAMVQDLVIEWSDFKAHIKLQARGYSTAGNLEVTDTLVDLDFYLPFLLQVFGKKIRAVVQEKMEEGLR